MVRVFGIVTYMNQYANTAIVFLLIGPIVAGCGSGVAVVRSPTSPAPTARVASPAVPSPVLPSQPWSLTRTLKSVAGPERCSDFVGTASANAGRPADLTMIVQRPGESLRIIIGDPRDATQYDGEVASDTFIVKSPPFLGYLICKGVEVHYSEEESITGRFAVDGFSLEGDEVDTYKLTSDETVTYQYAWHAVRVAQ